MSITITIPEVPTTIDPKDLQPILIKNAPRDPKVFMNWLCKKGLDKIECLGINDPDLVDDFMSNDYRRVSGARKKLNKLIAGLVDKYFAQANPSGQPKTTYVVPKPVGDARPKWM